MVLAVDRMGDNDIVLTGSKDHYIKVRSWKVKVNGGHQAVIMVLAVDRMGDNDIVLMGSKDHYIKLKSQEVKVIWVKVTASQGLW